MKNSIKDEKPGSKIHVVSLVRKPLNQFPQPPCQDKKDEWENGKEKTKEKCKTKKNKFLCQAQIKRQRNGKARCTLLVKWAVSPKWGRQAHSVHMGKIPANIFFGAGNWLFSMWHLLPKSCTSAHALVEQISLHFSLHLRKKENQYPLLFSVKLRLLFKKGSSTFWVFPVAQWLRIYLPMQQAKGTWLDPWVWRIPRRRK